MTDERRLVPFDALDDAQRAAVQAIYDQTFEDDERVPFEALLRWMSRERDYIRPEMRILLWNGRAIALSAYGYLPEHAFGYLAYVAVAESLRGQGHGAWLCEQAFARIREMGHDARRQDPRLTFWEVRRPEDPVPADEQEHRRRRIRFYQRLGAQVLPVEYLCPPIDEVQPAVSFHLMARTYPPGAALTVEEIRQVALTGLIDVNGAAPESEYVRKALASLK